MPDLSLQNINQISKDIRRQEITFSHLADELIDHICCDVEHEMKNGLNFHEAYLMVKEKMGSRRLKEIQEETLYSVDTKYRHMKNTMKISAIAGTVMLGFAALFKIMHWPGAGILLTLGAFTLAFVFMPSALTVLWKETHSGKRLFLYISAFITAMMFIIGVVSKVQHWPMAALILMIAALSGICTFIPALLAAKLKEQENRSKKIVYILGAVGLSLYILALLFKIQHWPGASLLMQSGVIIIFFVVFPWYTWITWKQDKNVSAKFIFMVVGSMALVIPGVMLNLNLQRNFDTGYYWEMSEQQAMFDYRFAQNRLLVDNCSDTAVAPVLAGINVKTNDLLKVIDGIEAKMISASEGKPGAPVAITRQIKETENGPEIQFETLIQPFQYAPFRDFLQDETPSRTELNTALKDYSDYLSGLIPREDFNDYEDLLDPSFYLPDFNPETDRISLMSGLHMLELMKNGILTAEARSFSAISKHQ
jgi:hypothetical protein